MENRNNSDMIPIMEDRENDDILTFMEIIDNKGIIITPWTKYLRLSTGKKPINNHISKMSQSSETSHKDLLSQHLVLEDDENLYYSTINGLFRRNKETKRFTLIF